MSYDGATILNWMQALRAMNNLTKYLISFALLCLSNVAISEEIEFSINCEILDQVILEAVDGKSERYSNIEGREKVGDNYKVKFKYKGLAQGYYLSIESKGDMVSGVNLDFTFYPNTSFVSLKNNTERSSLNEDYFRFRDNNQFVARRYYKNDWSALVTDAGGSRIMALNCMSVPAAYDQMLQKMLDYHKANPAKPK